MNQQRGVPRGSIYDGCPKTAGGNGWPSNRDEENGWESSGANFWGIFDHRGNNERNHVIFEESRRKKRQIFTLNYKRKKNENRCKAKNVNATGEDALRNSFELQRFLLDARHRCIPSLFSNESRQFSDQCHYSFFSMISFWFSKSVNSLSLSLRQRGTRD